MRLCLFALLLCLCALPLSAQPKQPVDMAVGYPSTTLVYGVGSIEAFGDPANLESMLKGMGGDLKIPDLSNLIAEKLELTLSKEELRDLARGSKRVSAGMLDIGIKGPKLQFILEHKDLSALHRALLEAAKAGSESVRTAEEYDGITIFNFYLALSGDSNDELMSEINPFKGWLDEIDLHAAILDNRYLILSGTASGCKDAIDGLLFPEDPADTLLGNKRYTESLRDFANPAALLFVNVQAVITTMERLSGDKGSNPLLDDFVRYYLQSLVGDTEIDAAFLTELTQYEQFKSFAAAMWLPESTGDSLAQARIEARLSFHNTPGWLDALRAEPKPMPMLDLLPRDTIFAATSCVDDFDKLYSQCKGFVLGRAREAGKTKLIDAWANFESKAEGEGRDIRKLWKQLGQGQAFVVVPGGKGDENDSDAIVNSGYAVLLGLKDWKQAEEFFYEEFLPGKMGSGMRSMEGELGPVNVIDGIEIHGASGSEEAFAFVPGQGKQGVLMMGQRKALAHILATRSTGQNVATHPSFVSARAAMWEKQNLGVYINVGKVLEAMALAFDSYSRNLMMFDEEGEETPEDRDDAEKDRNPIPRLARFFSNAVLLGGSRSGDTAIELRFTAAGVPPVGQFKELAEHYRDVGRNFEVRDDLLRVRQAAITHLVLKNRPALERNELVKSGHLARQEWGIDPYGAEGETPSTRGYKLAVVPNDVDIRQAILLAYQEKPGLAGNSLAILWNNHVVSLTPDQLKDAIERAAKGEIIDDEVYRNPLEPLFKLRSEEDIIEEPMEDPSGVEVVVIDDEGEESTIDVSETNTGDEVESILNQPKKPDDEIEPGSEPKKEE